jgi:predicted ATP-grasp superfamily ATP-dependent carboligase
VEQVKIIGYPLIVKPIDGVGCKGLTKADNKDELRFGLQSAHAVTNRDECLVQEFIEGTPISTTLLADGERVLPISINRQNLRLSSKNSFGYYLGGEIPLNLQEEKQEVLDTSEALVKKLGLTGFVGVDLVLSREGIFVMEVNPRITVPIIGLRDIISKNLAELLIDYIVNKKELDSLTLNGHASFTKITIPSNYSQRAKFEKVARIDGVRSPPFFIGDSSNVYAFLVGEGPTKSAARKNFQRVKNELLSNLTS